uniref:Uncharacterized protein n=1 Tax=Strombidium rassoulzadegani TaxID=1082188 RepID=A0A7S3CRW1_9SPIT
MGNKSMEGACLKSSSNQSDQEESLLLEGGEVLAAPSHDLSASDEGMDVAREKDLQTYNKAMRKLIIVSIVSVFFIALQTTGGIIAGSIAILTDSAHLATDMIGFAVSMIALRVSLNPSTKQLTYGWHRAEVIGTLMSVAFLLTATIWLAVEATKRILHPQEIRPDVMLGTAIMGFIFNLIQMKILHEGDGHYHLGGSLSAEGGGCGHSHDHGGHSHHEKKVKKSQSQENVKEGAIDEAFIPSANILTNDNTASEPLLPNNDDSEMEGGNSTTHDHDHAHDHAHDHGHGHSHGHGHQKERRNLNIDAAYLHVLGDLLMSVGVIIAAVIIYFFPQWHIADPICTYVFSVIVCFTVTNVLKECFSVLMEGSPAEIDSDQLVLDLKQINNVVQVHDFHLWSISAGKHSLSTHITCSRNPMEVLRVATNICRDRYNVDHVTIQMEDMETINSDVAEQDKDQEFICKQTTHQVLNI